MRYSGWGNSECWIGWAANSGRSEGATAEKANAVPERCPSILGGQIKSPGIKSTSPVPTAACAGKFWASELVSQARVGLGGVAGGGLTYWADRDSLQLGMTLPEP
jgi:hypothetical protein